MSKYIKESLEEDKIRLENKLVTIQGLYAEAVKDNRGNTSEAIQLRAEFYAVQRELKIVNRRLELLRTSQSETKRFNSYMRGKNKNDGHSNSDPVYL